MASAALSFDEYVNLVEQAPVLIWRCDTSGSCDYFNQRWLTFRGRSLAEETGQGWASGVHPADLHLCLQTFLGALASQRAFSMEYRLRRADGQYRWIYDCGSPFQRADGAFAGFIGSCVDVHERVEAQRLLDAARDRELQGLRGLLEICAHCKRIRNGRGEWEPLESFVDRHASVDLSHGMCLHCYHELLGTSPHGIEEPASSLPDPPVSK